MAVEISALPSYELITFENILRKKKVILSCNNITVLLYFYKKNI